MKRIVALIGAALFGGTALFSTVQAAGYGYGSWYGNQCGGCNSCCNPTLCPGQVSLSIMGGIQPIVFTDRQENEIVDIVALCEASAVDSTVTLEGSLFTQTRSKRASQFDDLFDIPWIAGAEIAYAVSCNTEIFIDGSYIKAEGRKDHFTVFFPEVEGVLPPPAPILLPGQRVDIFEDYGDLESYAGHIGFRYRLPRLCGCATIFFGAKAGFRQWQRVRTEVEVEFTDDFDDDEEENEVEIDAGKFTYFPATTVVSGGFQLGLNFQLCRCLEVFILAEALGTGSFKFGDDVEIERGIVNEIVTGSSIREAETILRIPVRRFGGVVTFPVQVGVRWTF